LTRSGAGKNTAAVVPVPDKAGTEKTAAETTPRRNNSKKQGEIMQQRGFGGIFNDESLI
jgi:hypothetical protein